MIRHTELGWNVVHKFGHNSDVDAAEDIWDYGGDYPWPSAAAATTIVSSSTDDAAAGTGARTVKVYGLDSNYNSISETATMTGTDAVALSNQYLRVFRAHTVTVGSGGVNAGNIQIKHSSTVLAQITASYGQTLMAIYTVPADNYTHAEMVGGFLTLGRAITSVAQVSLDTREIGNGWRVQDLIDVSDTAGVFQIQYVFPRIIPIKTDIRARVRSVSAANTKISAAFDLMLAT